MSSVLSKFTSRDKKERNSGILVSPKVCLDFRRDENPRVNINLLKMHRKFSQLRKKNCRNTALKILISLINVV